MLSFRSVLYLLAAFGCTGCGAGATVGSAPAAPRAASSGTPATASPATPPASATAAPSTAPTNSATNGPPGSGISAGVSPGPAIFYAPPAVAPELTNTGIWSAAPILVSGASAYRSGEYLYQDFLYDDHGAAEVLDPNQTQEVDANGVDMPAGTYTYPTAAGYDANAADLVEFRMKLTADATAFRITFNTMVDPALVGFTIALGGSTTSYAMPHGANATEPAAVFLTVGGGKADALDAASGTALAQAPTVTADLTRRQFTVLLPYADYDTRSANALRVAIACGLWNASTNAYLLPSAVSSTTAPGGAGTALAPAAFFNVGFRHAEPSIGFTSLTQTTGWRENAQAAALAKGDLSTFFDVVDTTKLAAGISDDMNGKPQGVPLTGSIDRIVASHFEPFQGRQFPSCASVACGPNYGNQLQPYNIYVPKEAPPPGGYPVTLVLHSHNCNYNEFVNTMLQTQFGERNGGSLEITTEDRGPEDYYSNSGLADTFEVWADVARYYPLNDRSVALTGYSMGGYGTFKTGVLFPDMFGKIQPTVGPTFVLVPQTASDTILMFATLRNIPILSWHASADELVPTPTAILEEQKFASLGLNFEWDLFSPAEHLTLGVNDQFAPAAAFLGVVADDVDPPHVTYVRNPSLDEPTYGVVADHAYWLSKIVERDTTSATGTIDVASAGFGVGDPPVSGVAPVAGTLTGGTIPALAYTGFKETYGAAPAQPVADKLTIAATNIASLTIAPSRAKVDCQATLDVTTDGPLTITLDNCNGGVHSFVRGRAVDRRKATPERR